MKRLAIIGAGPGGYPAAFHAADAGFEVTLIDDAAAPGGVCLRRGCIPSKALLHAARLIRETAEADAIGLSFAPPRVEVDRLRAWKSGVVEKLTGGLAALGAQRRVRYLRGRAALGDAHTLRVKTDAGEESVAFDHAILAAGSRPATLPGVSLASPRLMDSTGALALEDVPARLLVIGGGYIGLELGSVYAALGARVDVVEMLPALLPGADRDLVKPLADRLAKQFAAIRLETRVAGIEEAGDALRVTFADAAGGVRREDYDRALVAIGRRPNSESLGLENTRIRPDRKGFIPVDAQRRTAEPHIYAIGDLAGEPMLAHKATHEARVAVEAIQGRKAVFAPRAIPAVVFTDPEIAWAGLTETQAEKEGRAVRIARFPWAASGRALTLARAEGHAKWLCDPETGVLLGAGLVGPGAGDLIAEAALAIEMGATAQDLALTIHPHPTLSETLMEAAEVALGHCVHQPRKA